MNSRDQAVKLFDDSANNHSKPHSIHYLIVWNPGKAGARFRMDWRNIMRTPEKTLQFF
jgi:hypothetical protein